MLKVLKGHTEPVTSVTFSPDGKQIVSGSNDKSVQVWDVSTGNVLKVLKGHTKLVTLVTISKGVSALECWTGGWVGRLAAG